MQTQVFRAASIVDISLLVTKFFTENPEKTGTSLVISPNDGSFAGLLSYKNED